MKTRKQLINQDILNESINITCWVTQLQFNCNFFPSKQTCFQLKQSAAAAAVAAENAVGCIGKKGS